MKKAKIFLTALTVLAVVGGAVAFKAKSTKEFAQCNTVNQICELFTTTLKAVTTTNPAQGTLIPYDEIGDPCTTTTFGGPLTCTTLTKPSGE